MNATGSKMKEAMLYEKMDENRVKCFLCNHHCLIQEGRRGTCYVRENQGGTLYSLVYGRVISQNVDPVEKKPLYHFFPGSTSFSIATTGCNFRCLQCQNHEISQMPRESGRIIGNHVDPETIVEQALQYHSKSIAYTYTEPTIYFEYARDVAIQANSKDIKNVFVTNGYMTTEALQAIHPQLHAANVDLKSFSRDFYRDTCGAKLEPVLDSIRTMKELGIWIEVTTLIIPGMNDTESELRQIAGFLLSVGPEVPWHISAFYPTYKMTDRPRTPVQSLHRAKKIGKEVGLRYVYCGNVPGDDGENTFCYQCEELLVERWGYRIQKNRIESGKCPSCRAPIDGIGM
jgi:pyruvate formate lyase activating enzyme